MLSTQSKFLLLFLLFLLLACVEDKGQKIFDFNPNEKFKDSLNYHQQYLREISYIKTREDSVSKEGMVKITGGTYMMGGNDSLAKKDEVPRHEETIATLWVDETEVTNAEFREFIDSTGYVTTAERSFEINGKKYEPGALVFDPSDPEWWWRFEKGANWLHPGGPGTTVDGKNNHPVTQVSWYDAMAYTKWAGKRLPTEAEYEYFNRGGIKDSIYNWGNDMTIAPEMINYFQGNFPVKNAVEDNYYGTAGVKSFPPNGFDLYETAGNVWEWCLDTYHPNAYSILSQKKNGYFQEFENSDQEKVIRGGSFLCNASYCSGYRNAARMSSAPDTGLEHTGFRCVLNF